MKLRSNNRVSNSYRLAQHMAESGRWCGRRRCDTVIHDCSSDPSQGANHYENGERMDHGRIGGGNRVLVVHMPSAKPSLRFRVRSGHWHHSTPYSVSCNIITAGQQKFGLWTVSSDSAWYLLVSRPSTLRCLQTAIQIPLLQLPCNAMP
jgi:hypothetical protein